MDEHDVSGSLAPRGSTPGIDRRTKARIELSVDVGFYSDSNFYQGLSEDLSEGGLFVATHMLRPMGTVLTLKFALPTGREITAEGVVRWVRDPRDASADAVPGMGVQFRKLGPADEQQIREFIRLREPLFYES
jgi:uncharacterized protein (TIGR02266 family)